MTESHARELAEKIVGDGHILVRLVDYQDLRDFWPVAAQEAKTAAINRLVELIKAFPDKEEREFEAYAREHDEQEASHD